MTKNKSTELVSVPSGAYPILAAPDGANIIETLNDMGVSRFDLTKINAPAGGAVAFEVEGLAGVEYVKELEVIIGFTASNLKAWYRLSLDEGGGGAAPDCSSVDGSNGFGVVSMDASQVGAMHHCPPSDRKITRLNNSHHL